MWCTCPKSASSARTGQCGDRLGRNGVDRAGQLAKERDRIGAAAGLPHEQHADMAEAGVPARAEFLRQPARL